MANKLISADALQKAIRDDSYIDGVNFARVKKHIEEAEDAVKHGRWLTTYKVDTWMGTSEIDGYVCSECGRGSKVKGNYCPNCCAKMDGDGNG